MKTAGGEVTWWGPHSAPLEKTVPLASPVKAPHTETLRVFLRQAISVFKGLLMAEDTCGDWRQVEIQGVCLQPTHPR